MSLEGVGPVLQPVFPISTPWLRVGWADYKLLYI